MLEYKSAPITDLKFAGDKEGTGRWSAYGAYFGNVDHGGEILEPGCVKKIEKTRSGKVVVPLEHNRSNIVGECDVTVDEKGVRVDGELYMDLSSAADTKVLLDKGALGQMSIGFLIMKNGAKWSDDYMTRTIKKIHLFEVSLVAFGMNPKAKVTSVKSLNGALPDVRQFEGWLQSYGGFSRSEAVAIASVGYKAALSDSARLSGQSDSDRKSRATLLLQKHIANTQSIIN